LLFAFGDLIIHSLFRTSREAEGINLTSSYLDLSVLYGVDEAEMSGDPENGGRGGVRRHDGTGRLWEDCWADPRIAMMGPAVGAMLVVFCRNHNVSTQIIHFASFGAFLTPLLPPSTFPFVFLRSTRKAPINSRP